MWQELLIKSIMVQLPTEVECEYFVDLEKLENAFYVLTSLGYNRIAVCGPQSSSRQWLSRAQSAA